AQALRLRAARSLRSSSGCCRERSLDGRQWGTHRRRSPRWAARRDDRTHESHTAVCAQACACCRERTSHGQCAARRRGRRIADRTERQALEPAATNEPLEPYSRRTSKSITHLGWPVSCEVVGGDENRPV